MTRERFAPDSLEERVAAAIAAEKAAGRWPTDPAEQEETVAFLTVGIRAKFEELERCLRPVTDEEMAAAVDRIAERRRRLAEELERRGGEAYDADQLPPDLDAEDRVASHREMQELRELARRPRA